MACGRCDVSLWSRAVSWWRSPKWRYGPSSISFSAQAWGGRNSISANTYSDRSASSNRAYISKYSTSHDSSLNVPTWTISCGGGAVSRGGRHYVESRAYRAEKSFDTDSHDLQIARASCRSQMTTTWFAEEEKRPWTRALEGISHAAM